MFWRFYSVLKGVLVLDTRSEVNLFDIVIHIRGESGWESRCWSCVVQFLAVLCILLIPVATKPGALLSEKGARGTINAATPQ